MASASDTPQSELPEGTTPTAEAVESLKSFYEDLIVAERYRQETAKV